MEGGRMKRGGYSDSDLEALVLIFMLVAAVGFMFYGCASTPPAPAAPSPVAAEPIEKYPGEVKRPELPRKSYRADWDNVRPEWTPILVKALETHGLGLLQGKYEGACGEAKAFWVMLLSSLARYESGFKPETSYTENFADSKGKKVISRGIFQLSFESANQSRYGCALKDSLELHEAETGIVCAVKIANFLVSDSGAIHGKGASGSWLGLSRYFSPFRNSEKTKAMLDKARSICL